KRDELDFIPGTILVQWPVAEAQPAMPHGSALMTRQDRHAIALHKAARRLVPSITRQLDTVRIYSQPDEAALEQAAAGGPLIQKSLRSPPRRTPWARGTATASSSRSGSSGVYTTAARSATRPVAPARRSAERFCQLPARTVPP